MQRLTIEQQEMVSKNHNLIYSLANKRNIDLDDFYGVLAIGLCRAAMFYDESKGAFSTFAFACMMNEYKSELATMNKQSAIPYDKLLYLDNFAKRVSDSSNERLNFADIIPDRKTQIENGVINKITFKKTFDKLKPSHKRVVEMLIDGKRQTDIAEELGISRQAVCERVRKIRRQFAISGS